MSAAPPLARPHLLDGRGSDSPPNRGILPPRYLYYRMYTPDAAIKTNNVVDSNDQYLGQTVTNSVTHTPHTAASLKRHLRRIEGFSSYGNADLYLSLTSQTPLQDASRIALLDHHGPGSSEHEPMAIVIEKRDLAKRSGSAIDTQEPWGNLDKHEIRYVHYRLYNRDGGIATKTSFDETDPPLGRIETLSIAPPHTVASLKPGVLKVEDVINQELKIFWDLGGETPMSDDDRIDFFSSVYPGFMEDSPLTIVETPATQRQFAENGQDQRVVVLRKRNIWIEAKITCDYQSFNPAFLSINRGEILQTDGMTTTPEYLFCQCYVAMNSTGKWGIVKTADVIIQ